MYISNKLPQKLENSAWVKMLDPRQAKPDLKSKISVDVAIVGAGFAGLSAAWHLRKMDPTLNIAILEAQEIAMGSAGRNSGFMIDLPHEVSSDDYGGGNYDQRRHDIFVHRQAISLAKEVAENQEWGKEIFDPCGKYNVAMTSKGDKHVHSYARSLEKIKESHKVLSAEEIAEITGTSVFTSAIYTPGTIMINPAAYVRGIADSFSEPIYLFENTPVIKFEKQGNAWSLSTPNGHVSASKIILANNGYAQNFGLFPRSLLHVYTYAALSAPFDPKRLSGARTWAATPAFPMGTSLRRIQSKHGDRILVRARYTHHSSLSVSEHNIKSAGHMLKNKYHYRFPELKDIPIQYLWTGSMAVTLNSVPIFGEIESGLFSAIGCNGVGATKATALGIATAETVLGLDTKMTNIFKGYDAPKKLPPQPLLNIGAYINLKHKEWSAGIE